MCLVNLIILKLVYLINSIKIIYTPYNTELAPSNLSNKTKSNDGRKREERGWFLFFLESLVWQDRTRIWDQSEWIFYINKKERNYSAPHPDWKACIHTYIYMYERCEVPMQTPNYELDLTGIQIWRLPPPCPIIHISHLWMWGSLIIQSNEYYQSYFILITK